MLAVIVIYCTISLDVRLSLFILLEEKTYKIVSYNILSTRYLQAGLRVERQDQHHDGEERQVREEDLHLQTR